MTAGQILACFPLLAATVTDLRRRTIPDGAAYLIAACAALNVATGALPPLAALAGLLAVGFPVLLFAALDGGMGGGDVKLILALSALLGAVPMLWLLTAALLLFVPIGKLSKAHSLPFAPFLGGAFFILQAIQIIRS